MGFLKHFAGKQIYDLDDQDVLDFLIFKDINDSGRSIFTIEIAQILVWIVSTTAMIRLDVPLDILHTP